VFLYLGTAYPLEIVREQKEDLLLDEKFKLAEAVQSKAALTFERWYREKAKQILKERVNFYACQFGLQYKRIHHKNAICSDNNVA
jgi:predicted metal-dependent hydrolase